MPDSELIQRRLLQDADHARFASAAASIFAEAPQVIAAWFYGSAARGEAARDLDVAMIVNTPVSHAEIEALASRLQREAAPEGPEIDLRLLNGAAPRFQYTVIQEGRLLFERTRQERIACEVRIATVWADFRPTWLRMRDRMLARWSDG